nr:hypothetical protein [Burkholderia ubonensis]
MASYRDTFRLLLAFATKHIGRAPSKLRIEDFDVSLIEEFLQHLEQGRGNSVRTRNTWLAAVHAFFRFVTVSGPARAVSAVSAHSCNSIQTLRTRPRRVSHREQGRSSGRGA